MNGGQVRLDGATSGHSWRSFWNSNWPYVGEPLVIEKNPPTTTEGATSVYNLIGNEDSRLSLYKNERPFHLSNRRDQNRSSDLQPAPKLTISWSFSTDLESSRSLGIKEHPWGITRIANLRCPSKESSYLFEIAITSCTFLPTFLMWLHFLRGREVCIRLLSKKMPRNSIALSRPDVFSSDRGIPNFTKVCLRAEIHWSGVEFGLFTSRKSSKRWSTKGSLHLFRRIQQSTSDQVSNIFRQPKVSRTEKYILSLHLTLNRCQCKVCKDIKTYNVYKETKRTPTQHCKSKMVECSSKRSAEGIHNHQTR